MNVAIIAVVLAKHRPYYLLIINIVVFTILTSIQYLEPDLIRFHANNRIRIIDNASMAIVAFLAIFFIVSQILKDYDAQIQKLSKTQTLLKHQSQTDALTGVYNRRYIINQLDEKLPNRRNKAITLIMMDVDHFKSVNDTYGHVFGDGVLKTIASILVDNFRSDDIVARFGGEEFLIVLDNTTCSQAAMLGSKIRNLIKKHVWPKASTLSVTASFGIYEISKDIDIDTAIENKATMPIEHVDSFVEAQYLPLAESGAYSRTFGHLIQQHSATCSMNIRPPSPGAFSQAVEA